ncbi:hypothetical protein [Sphingomonas sp. SUN039]|uniref:hypothetical protein n=1 Tax=Sphingomonas sp. SUN039 TaxID=2937787 RepID=UPI002164C324|nr:hypothetical protein [Sphingomonas sp. SUN039]UVO53345.1 hypothetical protein M0209_04115 [Sphingomonas sp. SUN039]
MESFTGNGWFILGLTLVIGWLLGLLSRSGGAKWKKAYETERSAHLALRKDYDAHLKRHGEVVAAGQPVQTGAF